jgi:hypothetical protein
VAARQILYTHTRTPWAQTLAIAYQLLGLLAVFAIATSILLACSIFPVHPFLGQKWVLVGLSVTELFAALGFILLSVLLCGR